MLGVSVYSDWITAGSVINDSVGYRARAGTDSLQKHLSQLKDNALHARLTLG